MVLAKENSHAEHYHEPTVAPEDEAHIADDVSRVWKPMRRVRTSLRLQIIDAGHEVTTLDMPPSAAR